MSKFLTPERPAVLIGFYRGKEGRRKGGSRKGKEVAFVPLCTKSCLRLKISPG